MDDVTVTQEDREAAVAWHRLVSHGGDTYNNKLLSGEADADPLIQAFTRHRTTALAASQERLRIAQIVSDTAVRALEIVRGHTDADNDTSYRADDREGCLDAVYSEASQALGYIEQVRATALAAIDGGPDAG